MSLFSTLCDRHQYLELLESKYSLFRDDLDFAQLIYDFGDIEAVVNSIVKEVRSLNYHPGPVRCISVKKENKKSRQAYYLTPKDRLVLAVLQKALRALITKEEALNIYSNCPSASSMSGVRFFGNHVKKQAKNGKLDLYVIRFDFRNFFDTIPIHDKSQLWEQLRDLWKRDTSGNHTEYIWKLIEASVRPLIEQRNGLFCQNSIGIPTGSPMSALFGNIYPELIDAHLRNIEGGFYLRYGDDLIFAHPDPDVTTQANFQIATLTHQLELEINSKKSRLIYLTRCGKSCSTHPQFEGQGAVNFLGCQIGGDGTIRADKKHIRRLLRQSIDAWKIQNVVILSNHRVI